MWGEYEEEWLDTSTTPSSVIYVKRSLNIMGRVKSWLSSKLSIEAGKCDQADQYAEIAENQEGYQFASIEVPDFSYSQITDNPGKFSKKQRTIEDADGRVVAIVDYDAEDNVLGFEFLTTTTVTYDERRDQ